MRFSPNLLDEILRRTDIVQLVGRRVKLARKGRQFWGCCPFHKEKTASFKVENERRAYKCFGCGKGGDAFKWLMETEGLSFPEAVEKLAGEAGVELPRWSAEDEAREDRRKSLYEVIEAACVFFEEQLRARVGTSAREYLEGRGLGENSWKRFRLGYAPPNSRLIEHLKTKNVTFDDMIAAGLARPAEGDRPMRDFFFDRVMFPISDPRGRIVAFGARALEADAKPKYINTGETQLFSKGHLLYNFATARAAALKAQPLIVAEGYMDVIALVRAGFEAAVAPLGTALTEDQLHLLWRTAPEPILSFDGDEAGLRAAHRAARLALPHLKAGFSLRFAFLPAGEDPDSFIRASGPGAMKKVLDEAEPLARVLWRVETEGKDFSTPERRAGLERALAEITGQIQDGKIADYYRRDFEQKVFDAFKRRQRQDPRSHRLESGRQMNFVPVLPATKSLAQNSSDQKSETQLLWRVVRDPQLIDEFVEQIAEVQPLSSEIASALKFVVDSYLSGKARNSEEMKNRMLEQGFSRLVRKFETDRLLIYIVPKDAADDDIRQGFAYSLQQHFKFRGQEANENSSGSRDNRARELSRKLRSEERRWKGPTF